MPCRGVAAIHGCVIGVYGESPEQPAHPGHEIRLRGLQHEVKVIAHQAPRMDLPVGLATRLAQRPEECGAVLVVAGKAPGAPPERQSRVPNPTPPQAHFFSPPRRGQVTRFQRAGFSAPCSVPLQIYSGAVATFFFAGGFFSRGANSKMALPSSSLR